MPEYREIAEWRGYRVGEDGSVWSCKRQGSPRLFLEGWHQLTPTVNSEGYPVVGLRAGAKVCKVVHVHRLVLIAFRGPQPEGMEACHNDGDRLNCSLRNLRWDTPEANNADKREHGTHAFGERVPSAKLHDADIPAIFALRAEGWTVVSIATRYGVKPNCIHRVLSRKTFAHVTMLQTRNRGQASIRPLAITHGVAP